MRLRRNLKPISHIIILAILHLCWLTSFGWAEMIKTEAALPSQTQTDRQRLLYLLKRQDVSNELKKYGISPKEVEIRISSLTDEEVKEITGKLDSLPSGAGAEDILYVLLLPFTFVLGIVGTVAGILLYCLTGGGYFNPGTDLAAASWHPFIKNIRAIAGEEDCDLATQSCSGGDAKQSVKKGEEYCASECESDFRSCMGSVNEEPSEKKECNNIKNACEEKCSGWARGLNDNEERAKWCQNPQTNEYALCEEPVK